MTVNLMIRRRATMEETKEQLNARLMEQFVKLSGFWRSDKIASDALFDTGEEAATLILTSVLVDGLDGQVIYMPRFPVQLSEDRAMSDDLLTLEVTPEKLDYAVFCRNVVPRLLEIFGPYRAAMRTDQHIWIDDHMTRVNLYRGKGPNRDGRDTVERIAPVNFFDDLLCRRAFGIGAEEVVRRAAPECEHAEHMLNGAFLLVTTDIVTGRPALDALHDRVMRRIDADARRDR